MKTLKRTLCIALVLAMAVGFFAISAGAKSLSDYTDADKVSSQYKGAVDANTQLGVLKGMSETTYEPQGTLTRAQLATIIYRIVTGDVEDKYVKNYANASRFSDVAPGAWYAGYVNYCADNGYLKGMSESVYDPDGALTGYQTLAALLRAIGYDKNKEFEGKDWTRAVTEVADKINEGIKADWSQPITREVAAQLTLNTLVANPVVYLPLIQDYVSVGDIVDGIVTNGSSYIPATGIKFVDPLITRIFGLEGPAFDPTVPGIVYFEDDDKDMEWDRRDEEAVVTIPLQPIKTYTDKVPVCDLLVDSGVAKSNTKTVKYLFGGYEYGFYMAGTDDYTHKDTDKNGVNDCEEEYDLDGRGVLTQVYDISEYIRDKDAPKFLVFQTYYWLAKVTEVNKGGHGSEGYSLIDVYVERQNSDEPGVPGKIDSTAYPVGSYIIVHIVDEGEGEVVRSEKVQGEYVFECVVDAVPKTVTGELVNRTDDLDAKIVTYKVGDKTYNLNIDYRMSDCEEDVLNGKNYTWFIDQFGNLIGDMKKVEPTSYAVIDRISYKPGYNDDGTAPAIIYTMDGSKVSMADVTMINGAATTNVEVGGSPDYEAAPGALAEQWQQNDLDDSDWYDHLYVLSGKTLTAVDFGDDAVGAHGEETEIIKGIPMIEVDGSYIYGNEDTLYLYKYASGKYAAYKGVDNAPSVKPVNVCYVADEKGYIEVIFVDATGIAAAGSSGKYIIPADVQPSKISTDQNNNTVYIYNLYDLGGNPVKVTIKADTEPTLTAGLRELTFDPTGALVDDQPIAGYAAVDVTDGDTYKGKVFVDQDSADEDQYNMTKAKVVIIGKSVKTYASGDSAVVKALTTAGNNFYYVEAEYVSQTQSLSIVYVFVPAVAAETGD